MEKKPIIIPRKTRIFVGPEEEWKEIINGSENHLCNVSLLKNNNQLKTNELVWCAEKKIAYVPSDRRYDFGVSDYSDNYDIYISNQFIPFGDKVNGHFERTGNKEIQKQSKKQKEDAKRTIKKRIKDKRRKQETKNKNIAKKENIKHPSTVDKNAILIKEGSDVWYGDAKIHIELSIHKLRKCKVGLKKPNSREYVYIDNSKYCPSCDKYYLPYDVSVENLIEEFSNYQFKEASGYWDQIRNAKEEKKKSNTDSIVSVNRKQQKQIVQISNGVTNIKSEDFVVRTSSFSCRKNRHKCKEITACVTVIRWRKQIVEVFVPGWYCEQCGCYYISENDYRKIEKIGVIVAKVYTESDWQTGYSGRKDYSELSSESLLHKLGYNVGASDNLSDSIRHDILASAVDFKLLTKRRVIDFLTWMIKSRSSNDRYMNAICKWERDIDFISNYKLKTNEYVKVESITIREH